MTILIIDDEPQIRQVLRVMFQAQGYQTVEAANGADGLVATFTTNPDCIVLDIGLPDLSGIEVLQSIRRHSEVAVIMLTIHDDEQEKVRALDGGGRRLYHETLWRSRTDGTRASRAAPSH